MVKNKKIAIPLMIFLILGMVLFSELTKEKWEMNYQITNYAKLEGENNPQWVFIVSGNITLKNFNSDIVIITADAVDEIGNSINIFTWFDFNGNGTYSFTMESYYKANFDIVYITNIEVKQFNFPNS